MSTEQNNRTVKVCERCAGEEGSDRFTPDGKRYIVEFAKGRNVCRVCYNIARRVTKPPELFIRSVQLKIQRPEQPPQNSSPEQINSNRTIDQNDRSEPIHQLVTQMYSDMTASFSKIHISQVLETENTVLKDQIAELNNTIQQLKSDQINRSEQQNRTLIEQNEKLKHDYDAQLGSMFDQKEALEISKKQTDELNDKLKHDLQLVETKYNGQTVLLKMAQDEMKAIEEKFQAEIQELKELHEAELERTKTYYLDQMKKLEDKFKSDIMSMVQKPTRDPQFDSRPMTAPQTVNVGVVAGLNQRFEKLSPQSPPKGLPSHPNLAQIFNIKPDMRSGQTILEEIMAKNVQQIHLEAQKAAKKEQKTSPLVNEEQIRSPSRIHILPKPDINTPPKTNSPPRVHVSKTKKCTSCPDPVPLDQFDKGKHKCRECKRLGL